MLSIASVPASAQRLLCPATSSSASGASPAERPLQIEVSSALDFDRVALTTTSGGSVDIEPMSRSRSIGGGLVGLGGQVMTAGVTVRGEPGRAVRIGLPHIVELSSESGAPARITRLATDLSPAPRLGPDGTLRFTVGGRLDVTGGMHGNYRGRISITVDYQ